MTMAPMPQYLAVGRIVAPFGVRGEVKVEIHTDFPQRFGRSQRLYLGTEGDMRAVTILSARMHKGHALLLLDRCPDRTAAEALRGLWLYVPLAEATPLEEDEYYEFEVVGLSVETVDGELLGKVTEVIFTGANEVFAVQGAHGELLIPVLKEVVVQIDRPSDRSSGRIVVALPPGLR